MINIHALYNQKVKLNEITHIYTDSKGLEYMSFSKLYNFLSPKFDANFIAGKVADSPKNDFKSKEDVLKQWNNATDEGTRIDAALELYAQTSQILQSDEDLKDLIESVLSKYSKYHACHEQLVVYSEKYRCAGSLDKLGLLSNRKDSKFHLSDFKCFADGMSYVPKGQAWLNYPFGYLPNSKYTKINLQCSYYAYLFEELTGRKCERIFVDMIKPVKNDGKTIGYKNEIIPMTYLKHQIEVMLEHFKDKIINTLEPEQLPELEEF